MSRAFVFPGQGSQAVGMGVDLAGAFSTARDVFGEVDEALKQNLSRLMREGPEADLVLTENAQPALMAVSMAVIRILDADGGKPLATLASHVAGHSLGEYSALAAAGALKLADAACLLKLRGQAMQKAVPVGEGAMAALLGIDLEPAQQACEEAAQGEVVAVANDNGGGQVVVSGHKAAVERAIEAAKARGCKRGMLLPVSAPFHCPLMQPAADAMREALEKVELATPRVPLVANVLASEITNPEEIKRRLVEQVTGLVRWRESVQYMRSQAVDVLVECGSGKVLSGLVRRIDKDMTGLALNTPADIEAFLKTV
ncbi:ACP S-malonyltransferase [Enhydrobacter sp.]|jgi:[acyl-carrier-protein] S-malonyltransferase|uniref:ACP S-malonyltransferase n=1 Tax=Enhydrobacter sp. TaxID=1894999 RepID=UPI00261CB5D0|nr:ACP S-malonyltransferase [Enhydrobacter sp.]WIM13294.1 MAG: Malonyl CoA-acyl carrier protein transacylase [Enhydrobacter sp.]